MKLHRLVYPSLATLAVLCVACTPQSAVDQNIVGEELAVLTVPPEVPPPIERNHATKVVVNLEAVEQVGQLVDGVDYEYWSFGGSVPGRFLRVREGDLIEFHLANRPESRMPHNIDLHAVTGPGGGAASSFTAPGHETTFSFRAINPGLYVYHCATSPVGMHISNGMYGLILVEPAGGLPPVDREYYVMQGEFYTQGGYGEAGLQSFSMQKAISEDPEYVVFNGSVGSLVDDNALQAQVGETVRLFVGNGGPNLISSFHVIGEIFDRVYVEGGTTAINENVQTTLIPAGGAAIVEFETQVPGTYILVDHAIFRAFNKGALGMLAVTGPEDVGIYTGQQSDAIYLPEGGAIQEIAETPTPPAPALTTAEQIEAGERVYAQNCSACHQPNGAGIPGAFPPLAASDFLNADKARAINVVLHGLSEPIQVNGVDYNGVMPLLRLTDSDVANVLTYVYSQWNNAGMTVSVAEVAAQR